MSRTVCSFFQRGNCKFGDNCKYEHPRDGAQNQTFGNRSWTANTGNKFYLFTPDSIGKDLTLSADKPLWPLSSYAPAKYEPNLVSGLDESPEELRVKAVMALQTGAINDYLKFEAEKNTQADQIYTDARNRVAQAFEQASKQSNPLSATTTTTQSPPAFGGSSTGSVFGGGTSAFGQPSAFGSITNAPATNAFGGASFLSSSGTSSAFGPASAAATTSGFGKPAFGQTSFGQTTAPSSFAQPTSTFGPTQPTAAFGQVSQPQSSFIKPASGAFGSGSTFGQPSFGATASTSSAFSGAGSTSGGPSGTSGGFSAFAGQPSAFGLAATSSPVLANTDRPIFGQSSFGTSTSSNPPPAFGAPTVPAVPFGNPPSYQDAVSSTFEEPSAFSSLTQQQSGSVSAFGGSSFALNPTPAASGSTFGSASAFPAQPPAFSSRLQQNQPRSVFASTSTTEAPKPTSAFGGLLFSQNVASSSSSTFSSSTSAPSSSNRRSELPNLAAKKAMWDKYDSLLPDNYLQILPKTVREAFESQKFVWGKIPEWIPPKELR